MLFRNSICFQPLAISSYAHSVHFIGKLDLKKKINNNFNNNPNKLNGILGKQVRIQKEIGLSEVNTKAEQISNLNSLISKKALGTILGGAGEGLLLGKVPSLMQPQLSSLQRAVSEQFPFPLAKKPQPSLQPAQLDE